MLLYIGPIVFLFDDDPRIIHFLTLHYATRILISSDERPSSDIDEANAILNSCVIDSIPIYSRNFLTYNVHNLIHLANDVHKFSSLDHFSCFPFKNNMMCFRKMVRKPSLQLQQIYNRYMENQNSGLKKFQGSTATIIYAYRQKFTDNNQQAENIKLYYGIKIKGLNFNLQEKNHCCILTDGSICIIEKILKYNNIDNYRLVIQKFNITDAFYKFHNTDSRKVGIFKCSDLTEECREIAVENVKFKAYKMAFWQNSEQFYEKDKKTYVVATLYNDEWL